MKTEGYLDFSVNEFDEWIKKYEQYNKGSLPMEGKYNPYITLYTGEDHYRQMKAVLNRDPDRMQYAIENSGDDFEQMYLMMDHGLSAELRRGMMPEDLILYSGIRSEQVACFAGYPQGQRDVTVSVDELIALIGKEVVDEAYMSTTADLETAFYFSKASNVMVRIYASQKAMDRLGAVCVDPFSDFSGEQEVLFNDHARYRVLDVGKAVIAYTMKDSTIENDTRTCITLELL